MKAVKRLILLAAVLSAVLLLSGCNVSYDITSFGGKTTVQVNDVDDGDSADTPVLPVGKNRHAVITSALKQGQLQIDFIAVTVYARPDDTDDVVYGDTVASVTVAPGDTRSVPLDKGDYVAQLTAIGKTGGTLTIQIEKD